MAKRGRTFMVSAEREHISESGGYAPSGVQGQSPWSEGRSPPEADGILSTETSHFALNYIDELVILRHWTIYTDWHRSVINGLTRLDTGGGGKFTPRPLFWLPFPNRLGWTDEIWWLPKYVQGTKWVASLKSKMAAPKPEMHGKWLKVLWQTGTKL